MSAVQGADVRAWAARVVARVRFEGRSLKAAMPEALEHLSDSRDRALCEAMAFEALRQGQRYEFWLCRLLAQPLPESARLIHALLMVGLAQLETLQLPEYAALSATAEAARRLRMPRFVGLTNAVLRRFLRERETLERAAEKDAVATTRHPRWLLNALQRDWPEQFAQIIEHNNQQGPMWLRVNALRGSREAYQALLAEQGIETTATLLAPMALRLSRPMSPTTLPGWQEGRVSVQDLSAQCAVPLLEAQASERILEVGAAPGGKTGQILETWPENLSVVALDVDARRLARLQDALQRLGVSADILCVDAGAPEAWWDGQYFDRILLDVPCSATGVIRRQPDIKWHRQSADIAPLLAQQRRLLQAAWCMLRPGGRLVYVTCSVLRDENDRQIESFLSATPLARPVPMPFASEGQVSVGAQRFPNSDGGDGFYYAVVEKMAADQPADSSHGLC